MIKYIKPTEDVINNILEDIKMKLAAGTYGKADATVKVSTEVPKGTVPNAIIDFSEEAYHSFHALVESCDKEIGWHCVVTRDPEESNKFLVHKTLVFPQVVTSTTVDPDDVKYGMWTMSLSDEDFNGLRFHGHSHVNMGVTASAVDTTYQANLMQHIPDFYIFLILNKRGDYSITLFDIENNLLYDDKSIDIIVPVNTYKVWAKEQIAEYVELPAPAIITPSYQAGAAAQLNVYPTDYACKQAGAMSMSYKKGWTWRTSLRAYAPSTMADLEKFTQSTAPKKESKADKKKRIEAENQKYLNDLALDRIGLGDSCGYCDFECHDCNLAMTCQDSLIKFN